MSSNPPPPAPRKVTWWQCKGLNPGANSPHGDSALLPETEFQRDMGNWPKITQLLGMKTRSPDPQSRCLSVCVDEGRAQILAGHVVVGMTLGKSSTDLGCGVLIEINLS